MSNYVRSVRALGEEIRELGPPRAEVVRAVAPAEFVAEPPQPIAVVGVHGISPIQQFGFQDQFATGLLAYLNARDDLRFGVEFVERRCPPDPGSPPPPLPPGGERRSGRDRRSGPVPGTAAAASTGGERRRVKTRWAATPYWPRVATRNDDPVLKPSALRLHLRTEPDHTRPTTQVYDVYEGYWSPLSKGKSKLASLMLWLLRCTFLATSSTARLPATWRKLVWDLGYVFAALTLVLGLFAGAALAGAKAWTNFLGLFDPQKTPPPFWEFAGNPFARLGILPWFAWVHLVAVIVLAYLLVQLVQLGLERARSHRRKTELLQDSGSTGHFRAETVAAAKFHAVLTCVFVAAFLVLAIADVVMLAISYEGDPYYGNAADVVREGLWLVFAVAMVQLGRWLANFVVENILGDVQIYTTHDCNSTFYGIRQTIISTVTSAMLGAVNAVHVELDPDGNPITVLDGDGDPVPPPPLYAKIHIAGHSLGSTIALDVLLRIRQLTYEGSVTEDGWGRVRSLTTFGTALEKTRFLLDVRNPSVSAAAQQWQNDSYGRFFTRKRSTLTEPDNRKGIFWSNHWYAHDIVANRIVSYKSVVKPGSFGWVHGSSKEHAICRNNLIPHKRWPGAFVHGDYTGDALFWNAVGPVLTG